jgi:hypothetical protein
MGINTHIYTVYGVKTGGNDSFIEDYKGEADDPEIFDDCYCGEYIVFGVLIGDSGDLRYQEPADETLRYTTTEIDELALEYKQKFLKKYPKYYHLIDTQFRAITFYYYT